MKKRKKQIELMKEISSDVYDLVSKIDMVRVEITNDKELVENADDVSGVVTGEWGEALFDMQASLIALKRIIQIIAE